MPSSAQLEFYPGAHVLIWVVDGKPTVWVQAWGGSDPIPGWDDGGMRPRKTTPGRFIIQSRGPHSTHKWPYSLIHWGTRLRVEGTVPHETVLYETGMLICYGADRSEQNYARASCRRPRGEEWRFDDQHLVPPINCGPWVITHGRRDEQVVVFSFDGQVVGRRSFPGQPVYACGDSGTLVIGARRVVQMVKLPFLEPVWTRRLEKGNVVVVAAPKGAVAYATDASGEVVVVRR